MLRSTNQAARRQHGRYYTPQWLAREVARGCHEAFRNDVGRFRSILDSACGDGVFLAAAFETVLEDSASFSRVTWTDRWEWATRCLFGVDNDRGAVELARSRLVELIAPPASERDAVLRSLQRQILWGDALSGPGFGTTEVAARDELSDAPAASPDGEAAVPAIDWPTSFPEVAEAGGFDWILGNPPYRRERYAQQLFRQLAGSPLGRWRQPRMDLWHYFLHRGLDLLRPGGRLAFVVNGYWTSARSASPLMVRLRDEATIEELRRLEGQNLFPGVTGRHMAFRLRKGRFSGSCLVRDDVHERWLSQEDLFTPTGIIATPARSALDEAGGVRSLGSLFEVRQGIAENPPAISASHLRRSPDTYRSGEGVFVLTTEERDAIPWTADEARLFRPYFRPRDIERTGLPAACTRWLLYLTRDTAPDLAPFPNLMRHLGRFRPLLSARREVQRGCIDWWHLHWPREERLFLEPRVLAVQMVDLPRFCFVEQQAFVGFSVNVIAGLRNSSPSEAGPEPEFTLPVLAALLNSLLAADWFRRHAKHRGAQLDISGGVLRQFPIPAANAAAALRIAERLAGAPGAPHDPGNAAAPAMADADLLEAAIQEWYFGAT